MRDRLIDLLENARFRADGGRLMEQLADHLLDNDTVAVVRCKDCDFCIGPEDMCGNIYCRMHMGRFDENAFCSYGRRKRGNDS